MTRKRKPLSQTEKGRRVAADDKHPWRRWNTELFKSRQPSTRKPKPESSE